MFNFIKHQIIRLLKIPPEPGDPTGSEGSLRVFRAAKNYYRYRLFKWGLERVGLVVGIIAYFVQFSNKLHTFARVLKYSLLFVDRISPNLWGVGTFRQMLVLQGNMCDFAVGFFPRGIFHL